jgi:hypothetical protein
MQMLAKSSCRVRNLERELRRSWESPSRSVSLGILVNSSFDPRVNFRRNLRRA